MIRRMVYDVARATVVLLVVNAIFDIRPIRWFLTVGLILGIVALAVLIDPEGP